MNNLAPYDESKPGNRSIGELLGTMDIFSDLEPQELELLATWVEAYTAKQDDLVLKEGSEELYLCLVADGGVTIEKKTSPFESIKLADIMAGGVLGEMGIIEGKAVSANVRAACDSVVLMISRERFQQLLTEHGELGVKLLWRLARLISSRMRQTTALLAELSMSKASWILKY